MSDTVKMKAIDKTGWNPALEGPGGQIPETLKPGASWADEMVREAEKLQERLFNDEKISKEFREIFGVLNSENSNMRRGALKALIAFAVINTKVSKSDVRSVCQDLTPVHPTLRAEPQRSQKKTSGDGQKEASPSNKLLRLRQAELRAIYPDYNSSGLESEYAKMKKLLVEIHKGGQTIEGPLPKTLDLLQKMPRKAISSV